MSLNRTLAPTVTFLLLLAPDLARADGELDTSFLGSGILVQDLGSPSDHVAGMKIAPGGRIVVAGDILGPNNRDLTVFAFTPEGQLDTSFAGTGKVTADFGGDEEAAGLAIDRDGSIVVVGTRAKDGLFEVVIVKYLSNGSLDTSFNGSGRRVLAFSDGANNFGNAVALELDGRIVIGGTRTNANGSVFAIARLRKNGTFDTSLDGNGKKFIDFGVANGRNVFGNAVAVQDDRKIVIAGRRVAAGGTDFALARIHPDGALDAGFGSNGKTDVEFGGIDEAFAVALRPEGRIVVAGRRQAASGTDFAVALLRANGSLDTSFKGNGKASTDFGANEGAYAVMVQPDGKMLVAGERQGPNGRDFAIARYLEDGSLDPSLDSDGKQRYDIAGGSSDVAVAVGLQANGRILLAGSVTAGSNTNLGLIRLLSTSATQRGALEIPGEDTFQSGIGLISGWHCTGPAVRVRIDGRPLLTTAYGTARGDTLAACGDTNNGFGLLFNWNLLSDGPHIIRAFAQGQEFASAVFEVRSLGVPFLRGASGTFTLPNFPRAGRSVDVGWAEALQGFVITNATGGGTQSTTGTEAPPIPPERPLAANGLLENPSNGSFQSGVGLISGWVCDATNVQILIDDRPALRAAYGTARGDTEATCGDIDNGFGLLLNWNLLGDGPHTLVARADGQVFASATFTVTTLGVSFLRGASGTYTLPNFPEAGRSVDISWAEAQQNFVIVDRD